MAGPRGWARLAREGFPRVLLEVESPEVAVVVEALLVGGGELAAEDVHVSAVRDRLMRAARGRGVGALDQSPTVLVAVVSEEIAVDAGLAGGIHSLAAEHDDLRGLLRERGGERAVTPRSGFGHVVRHLHLRLLRVHQLDGGEDGVDVVGGGRLRHATLELRLVLVRLAVRLCRAGGSLGLLAGALRQLLTLVAAGTHRGDGRTRGRGARVVLRETWERVGGATRATY